MSKSRVKRRKKSLKFCFSFIFRCRILFSFSPTIIYPGQFDWRQNASSVIFSYFGFAMWVIRVAYEIRDAPGDAVDADGLLLLLLL